MLYDSVQQSVLLNNPKQWRKKKKKLYLAVVFFEYQRSVISCDQKLSAADFETLMEPCESCERFCGNL